MTLLQIALVLAVLGVAGLAMTRVARSQRAEFTRRVEEAVGATFPRFCAGDGERMTIERSSIPFTLARNRYWDVRCDPGSEITGPAMTIDTEECSVLIPRYGVLEWPMVYGTMFKDGDSLAVCP